jgi:hypothetical protein
MQLSMRLSMGVSTRRSVAGLIAKRAATPSPEAKSQSAAALQSVSAPIRPARAAARNADSRAARISRSAPR